VCVHARRSEGKRRALAADPGFFAGIANGEASHAVLPGVRGSVAELLALLHALLCAPGS